jgi:hypothetical protein
MSPEHSVNSTTSQLTDIQNLAKTFSDSVGMARLAAPEPPKFSGDPLMFGMWKSSFMTLVESRNIPTREKIHYRQRYLKGEAKECIEGLFYFDTKDAYDSAWLQLERRYGHPFIVAEAFRNKLYKWPDVCNNDHKALRKFADFLIQCSVAKQQISDLKILDDCHDNKQLLRKLPR